MQSAAFIRFCETKHVVYVKNRGYNLRYIGSKQKVLPFIKSTIEDTYGDFSGAIIGDLFSGTACVGEMFKSVGAQVISNDYMNYSYAFQVEKIKLNSVPDSEIPYSELIERLNKLQGVEEFFYNEYTIEGSSNKPFVRNYFSADNGKKIDAIRLQIGEWKNSGIISSDMFYLLIANLIDAVTKVSNTSGTYGAFLKVDDPRKYLPITLSPSEFINNGKKNSCYCKDVFDVIDNISGDILYLDPPYNNRQYPPYYHILDTVTLYDYPSIYGKTGRRPYNNQLSTFCMSDKAGDSLVNLVKKANFEHIYISYSTDGLVDYTDLIRRLSKIGETSYFFTPYKRYKSNSNGSKISKHRLKEIIIYVKK